MRILMQIDRDAALRAGRDKYGWQPLDIAAADLTTEEREQLIAHDCRRYASTEADGTRADYAIQSAGSAWPITEPTVEGLRAALASFSERERQEQEREQQRQQEKTAEHEARVAKLLALPTADLIHQPYLDMAWDISYGLRDVKSDPRVAGILAAAEALAAERNAQREAKRAAREQAEQQAEERKHAQLAEAVARLGTESQKERWAEGLLPTREAIDLIVAEKLAPLDGLRIESPSEYWVAKCSEECNGTTSESQLETLTDEEWNAFRLYRTDLAKSGAEIEYYRQSRTCEHAKVRASLARVTWTVGEIEIERDIVLAEHVTEIDYE
jgi:hypothetical protein